MMNVIDQDLYLTFLTILQYGLICSQTVKFQEVYIVPAAPQWRSYFVNVPLERIDLNYVKEMVFCPRLLRQSQLLFRLAVRLER